MKKDKKQKLIAILALCISVVGLTLGFAAFSNTLTISSSAKVTPDASDFKMVIYGLNDAANYQSDVIEDAQYITSTENSDPILINTATSEKAVINNNTLTLENINPSFKTPGDRATYVFKVVNEGKYVAYLKPEDFQQISEKIVNETQCIAATGTTEAYVSEACNDIVYSVDALHSNGWASLSSSVTGDTLAIEPGEYIELLIEIRYTIQVDQIRADGNFNITFPDIKLNFSTVNPDA